MDNGSKSEHVIAREYEVIMGEWLTRSPIILIGPCQSWLWEQQLFDTLV